MVEHTIRSAFVAAIAALGLVAARAEDISFRQSFWQADENGNLSGNFSDTAHWDTGAVPTTNETTVVNGFLLTNATYAVTNDATTTVPYLHIQSATDEKVSFVVEKPLTVAPPSMKVTYYKPESKSTDTGQSARGLWLLNEGVTMTVPEGSSLTVDAGTVNENYDDRWVGKVMNGARVNVDGATLNIKNLNKGGNFRETFLVEGTANATSRIDVLNGSTLNVSHYWVNGYGYGFVMRDYSLLNVVDSTFSINNRIANDYTYGSEQTGPGPEVRLSGNSRMLMSLPNDPEPMCGSGTYVFSGNSCLSNLTSAGNVYLGADRANTPFTMVFKDHASANINLPSGTAVPLWIGHRVKNIRSSVTFDSDGELVCGNRLNIGNTYGYAELNILKGTVRQTSNYGASIGRAKEVRFTDAAVTGVVNVAGGVFSIDAPSGDQSAIYGLLIGDGTVTSANVNSNYFYGALNLTEGAVTVVQGKCAIGCGTAKGVARVSGGSFTMDSHLILGLRGGTGEFRMTGGSFSMKNSYGNIWVGGVPGPGNLNLKSFGTNVPETRGAAQGLLSVRNATFTMGEYGQNGVCLGFDGTGILELGEDGLVNVPYVYATSNAQSVVRFVFSDKGTGTLQVRQRIDISEGAKLVVDARDCHGTESWVQLVKLYGSGNYGSVQGETNGDRFLDVTTYGPVKVVQNPKTDARHPGIWAHVMRGTVISVR